MNLVLNLDIKALSVTQVSRRMPSGFLFRNKLTDNIECVTSHKAKLSMKKTTSTCSIFGTECLKNVPESGRFPDVQSHVCRTKTPRQWPRTGVITARLGSPSARARLVLAGVTGLCCASVNFAGTLWRSPRP